MNRYVLGFEEIDEGQVALVGGKGANLGELSRIEGIRVPAGFCVTTDAFQRVMAQAPSIDDRLDRLSRLQPGDRASIGRLSAEIRQTIEAATMPDDLAAEITRSIATLGERAAYAVRSSATAEDLPTASFAGQQDTYLNVVGLGAILRHVSRCWASLFTERAVIYRLRNGVDHRTVRMAVVVQADGLRAGGRRPVHRRPGHGQPHDRLRGGQLRPRRGPGLRPGERGHATRCGTARSSISRSAPSSLPSSPRRPAGRRSRRSSRSGSGSPRSRMRRSFAWWSSAGGSRPISAVPRTSNGAWSTTTSRSSRAVRSPPCSRSPRPATTRTTSTCPSDTRR